MAKQKKLMVMSLVMASVCSTLLTSHTASAGLFDWFGGDDDGGNQPAQQQPNYYYPPGQQPGNVQPRRPLQPGQPPQPGTPVAPGAFGMNGQVGNPNAAARGAFQTQSNTNLPMYVVKTAWTDADEANWAKFIAQLGQAISSKQCNTVKQCMQSPVANMYANQDPPGLILYSDCAEFPYMLRTYFAYHNGLPFSHVTNVKMNMIAYASDQDQDSILPTKQLDNDPYGNIIVSRGGSDVPARPGQEQSYIGYLIRTFNGISTRSFRVGPLSPNYDLSDVYPVTIDRNGIGAGTIVHTTGHAMVVWNVDPQGTVHVIDGHPDGSVQFKNIEGSTLERSRPDNGLGFFRFRPLQLVGAKLNANGAYYGGKVVSETDQQLLDEGKLSLDQWFGPGSGIVPGAKVDPQMWKSAFKKEGGFFVYLAAQLRDKNITIQADDQVAAMISSLCDQMQQRVNDVDAAVKQGLTSVVHPDALPDDVFGEQDSAVWGPYATNGRDGRLKASVNDILRGAVSTYKIAKAGGSQIRFDGTPQQYIASLRAKVAAMDKTCVVTYKNSASKSVAVPFNKLLARFNKMSFDPYMCPEKRWGASGPELATCVDMDKGNVWYKAESYMCNTVDKNNANGVPVIRSDRPITLSMLQTPSLIDTPDSDPVDLGTATPPIMNLDTNFASQKFFDILTK